MGTRQAECSQKLRFETQVGASVVGRSAREDAAQSGLQENSKGGKAAITAPVQVILFQTKQLFDRCINRSAS